MSFSHPWLYLYSRRIRRWCWWSLCYTSFLLFYPQTLPDSLLKSTILHKNIYILQEKRLTNKRMCDPWSESRTPSWSDEDDDDARSLFFFLFKSFSVHLLLCLILKSKLLSWEETFQQKFNNNKNLLYFFEGEETCKTAFFFYLAVSVTCSLYSCLCCCLISFADFTEQWQVSRLESTGPVNEI